MHYKIRIRLQDVPPLRVASSFLKCALTCDARFASDAWWTFNNTFIRRRKGRAIKAQPSTVIVVVFMMATQCVHASDAYHKYARL